MPRGRRLLIGLKIRKYLRRRMIGRQGANDPTEESYELYITYCVHVWHVKLSGDRRTVGGARGDGEDVKR